MSINNQNSLNALIRPYFANALKNSSNKVLKRISQDKHNFYINKQKYFASDDCFFEKKIFQKKNYTYFKKRLGKNYVKIFNLASNDYLGLSKNKIVSKESSVYTSKFGTTSGGSRLISGNQNYHEDFEENIANFMGYQTSILFGSGTLCNIGVISAIASKQDICVIDKLSHSSIIEGVQISGAKMLRFNHSDLADLKKKLEKAKEITKINTNMEFEKFHNHLKQDDNEEMYCSLKNNPKPKIIVITESVFSMDGDTPPLKQMLQLCNEHNAFMIVDESHGIGVIGRNGQGVCHQQGIKPYIITASLGKALASYGGICLCNPELKHFLINKSREFIFTTSLPPSVIGAANGSLKVIMPEIFDKSLKTHISNIVLYLLIFFQSLFYKKLKLIKFKKTSISKLLFQKCEIFRASLLKNIDILCKESEQNFESLNFKYITQDCENEFKILLVVKSNYISNIKDLFGITEFSEPKNGYTIVKFFTIPNIQSAILPLIFTNETVVKKIEDLLIEEGIFIKSIKYPTVEKGKPRLRITLSNLYSKNELVNISRTISKVIFKYLITKNN